MSEAESVSKGREDVERVWRGILAGLRELESKGGILKGLGWNGAALTPSKWMRNVEREDVVEQKRVTWVR